MTIEELISVYQKSESQRTRNEIFKEVWKKNQGIVFSHSKGITDRRYSLEVFESNARFWTLRAIDSFDTTIGTKFSTFLANTLHAAVNATNREYYTVRPYNEAYKENGQTKIKVHTPSMTSLNERNVVKNNEKEEKISVLKARVSVKRVSLELLKGLDPEESKLLKQYYYEGIPMSVICLNRGLSHERIRQRKDKVLAKLKRKFCRERSKWI